MIQWGKVTEAAFTPRLDTTGNALRVYGVLACKAGPTRRAWMSQDTMAKRLGVHRTTVQRSIKRLTAAGLIKVVGRIVVDRSTGAWLPIYLVAPWASDQPVVHPGGASGLDEVDPMSQSGVPDAAVGGTRSSTQVQHIQFPKNSSSKNRETDGENPEEPEEQERNEEEEPPPTQPLTDYLVAHGLKPKENDGTPRAWRSASSR